MIELCLGIATVWWLPLPILIFAAEMAVITLDTIRTIFIARGKKALATSLALFEVSIWLFAISQVMQNLSNPACMIGYAAGFTVGTYVGIRIEEKLALGTVGIRIITNKSANDLISSLRSASFGVTSAEALGTSGPVEVIFTVVKRSQLEHVIDIIERCDPSTFYSVEDMRSANGGVFQIPQTRHAGRMPLHAFGLDNAQNSMPLPNLLASVRNRLTRIVGRCIWPLRARNRDARPEVVQMPGKGNPACGIRPHGAAFVRSGSIAAGSEGEFQEIRTERTSKAA